MGDARRLDGGRRARRLRLVAAAAVLAAAAGYVREREWLDAINAGLWIAIVIMFEWQVRFPATVGQAAGSVQDSRGRPLRRRWACSSQSGYGRANGSTPTMRSCGSPRWS